jgi:hypothetical protein
MKSILSKILLTLFLIAVVFSCKKDDDSTPPGSGPIVSLNGDAIDTIPLNSTWNDPGATAVDYQGTHLNVTSNSNTTNPNTHVTGNYTITYSATDSYSRTGAVSRLVIVDSSYADITPPVITLNGSSNYVISLNGTYTDLGASAFDNQDGVVTVLSNISATNPNVNNVGTYTITYTSVDAAGNVATETRTVRIKNDAESFAGTYDVFDSLPGFSFYYVQVIFVDNTINNRVHFNRFADYVNNTAIFANKNTNGELEIPLQSAVDIGSGVAPCDIATHQFASTNYVSLSNGFKITYTDEIISPGSCIGSYQGIATYTKQ